MDKIKIVRVAPINGNAMDYFLKKKPTFPGLPYSEQVKIHSSEGITYGTGFSRAMTELGYESVELIYDFQPLQRRWAMENSVDYDTETWISDILIAQLRNIQPDVVHFQGGVSMIPEKYLNNLKKMIPSIKLLLLHLAYPVPIQKISCIDHVFAGYPQLFDYYIKAGLSVSLLYHGFDHHILELLPSAQKIIPFSFAGSTGHNLTDHRNRYWALHRLMRSTPLQVYCLRDQGKQEVPSEEKISKCTVLYNRLKNSNPDFHIKNIGKYPYRVIKNGFTVLSQYGEEKSASVKIKYHNWRRDWNSKEYDTLFRAIKPHHSLEHFYTDQCHQEVHGLDMYQILANSFATFQIGVDQVTYQNSGAMRLFEAPGVKTALFTDNTSNIRDIFCPDKEIIVYDSIHDCIRKIKYYLEEPDELIKIGSEGQKRVLSDHTVCERCKEIDHFIRKEVYF